MFVQIYKKITTREYVMTLSMKTKRKILRILENTEGLSKMEFTNIYNELFGVKTKSYNYNKKEKK